ncbi:hypothetical protein BDV23DRAFT_109420 [Aspergillus alliaceus]|uniref:Uncharacterized protein n=1 Tax=Petromyces alliaceus TaxID=209559 RepID=A0A5N7C4C5_PETAA|nr:hypothetical protein BDV23DRAFT_109420 [Aspergillus alliaceus]
MPHGVIDPCVVITTPLLEREGHSLQALLSMVMYYQVAIDSGRDILAILEPYPILECYLVGHGLSQFQSYLARPSSVHSPYQRNIQFVFPRRFTLTTLLISMTLPKFSASNKLCVAALSSKIGLSCPKKAYYQTVHLCSVFALANQFITSKSSWKNSISEKL